MSTTPSIPISFIPSPPVGGSSKTSAFSPAVVAVIAVLGSAFLVVSYYRIFAKLCTRWQHRRDEFDMEGQLGGADMDANPSPLPNHGLDEALIKKIPIFAYKSGDGFTLDTDCPVCLMEFVEQQELRMLPKCAHTFHIACIDTWLGTHFTCPLCRANIWPDQLRNQYSPSSPLVYGADARLPPGSERMEYGYGDGALFNGHGRYPGAPTLRGLLNYEDQHNSVWIPDASGIGDPGEESLRLFNSRDHEGDSSARHHSGRLAAGTPTQSASENAYSRSGTYFSTDTGPQVSLTRTASFKEPHSRSRDREHKWHIPARRPSFRRNPFSIARSYSMGTSRRLVHALEFLDLEDLPNSQRKGRDKLYSPHEYGIIGTPDYRANLTTSPVDPQTSEGEPCVSAAGPSTLIKEAPILPLKSPGSSSDVELAGAALKSSSVGRGRSLSFRSPFTLKRSLSGGRHVFSFRHSKSAALLEFETCDWRSMPGSVRLEARCFWWSVL